MSCQVFLKFLIIGSIGIGAAVVGLAAEAPPGFFIEVDTRPPKISCSPPGDVDVCGGDYTEPVEVFCTTEPDAVLQYSINGGVLKEWTESLALNATTTLALTATDSAGNPSELECVYNISIPEEEIDRRPIIIINTDSNQCFGTTSPLLDVDFEDETGLRDGFYQIDSYQGSWSPIPEIRNKKAMAVLISFEDDFYLDQSIWDGLAEGPHLIYFRAVDEAGNETVTSPEQALLVRKDTIPPETSIQCNGGECAGGECFGWYKSDVSVSLSCADTNPDGTVGCGCAKTYAAYCPNIDVLEGPKSEECSWFEDRMEIAVNTNGINAVGAYSIDDAGNTGPETVQLIRIDKEEPNIAGFDIISPNPADSHTVNMFYHIASVVLAVADTGTSHLKQVELLQAADNNGAPGNWAAVELSDPVNRPFPSIPDGLDSWSNSESPFMGVSPDYDISKLSEETIPFVLDEGIWWYKLRVSDNACHSVDSEPIKLTVDRQPPTVDIISPETGTNFGSALEPPSIDLEVEFRDQGSGLSKCEYGFYDPADFYEFYSGEPVTLQTVRQWLEDNVYWDSMGTCAGQGPVRRDEAIDVDQKDCRCSGLTQKVCACSMVVQAEDIVGNWNFALTSFAFQLASPVESTRPETSLKCNGGECKPETEWYNEEDGQIEITLECQDNGSPEPSGCKETYINGQLYDEPFYLDEGVHSFEFYSIDNAGNQEAAKSQTIKRDITSPVLGMPSGAPAGWTEENQTAVFTTCQDNLSGCNPNTYAVCAYILSTGETVCTIQPVCTADDECVADADFLAPVYFSPRNGL